VVFLFPVALAGLSQDGIGSRTLGAGWVAVYAIEIVLYVVGAAFIVLVLAKDRTVSQYKLAAATDPLTELLNRRGFFDAAAGIMAARQASKEPVCVLAFDLDHFKSINDRFGHNTGDATLHLFAAVVKKTLRAGDAIGRLGGEEFIALLPSTLGDAVAAANRVRRAFASATAAAGNHAAATVSAGVACGSAFAEIDTLIARADAALYRAKTNGRDRVEASDEAVPGTPERRGQGAAQNPQGAFLQPVPNLAVPLVGSFRAARQNAVCRS
jgi:diguanylate cyclase (GGDEF)-like protein